jgi:hypothetical protein
VEPTLPAIERHPSEATTLLAAAASGIRGVAETRDAGHLVEVSSESANGYILGVEAALELNPLARQLRTTTSFGQAEAIATAVCGKTELSHERAKARLARSRTPTQPFSATLAEYKRRATDRGATITTFRRISEVLRLPGYNPSTIRGLLGRAADPNLPLVRISKI